MALNFRKLRHSLFTNTIPRFLAGLFFIYVYCEYLIYYVTQIQCGFPTLSKMSNVQPVYAMVFADPHLLGPSAHWMDKWRREWQMHRAFQTAMTLHRPEVVFVLGDLFDEGDKCSEKEFNEYVQRFYELFKVPDKTSLYAVAGNHDIGFHYKITAQLSGRWERRLRAPPVRLLSVRGAHFVLLNSMALQGDGCELCARADAEIHNIAALPMGSSEPTEEYFPACSANAKQKLNAIFSNVAVDQNYVKGKRSLKSTAGLYLSRASDSPCTEPDAAPLPARNNLFVERRDCLSKESTEYLVERLRPRLAFGAHTHHSCALRHSFVPTPNHKIEFVEYTVPSFSWRNRMDPKYYLVTISPEEARVSKCELPQEWTIQFTAVTLLTVLVLYLRCSNSRQSVFNYKLLSGKKV